jgi:hypothetical protein
MSLAFFCNHKVTKALHNPLKRDIWREFFPEHERRKPRLPLNVLNECPLCFIDYNQILEQHIFPLFPLSPEQDFSLFCFPEKENNQRYLVLALPPEDDALRLLPPEYEILLNPHIHLDLPEKDLHSLPLE